MSSVYLSIVKGTKGKCEIQVSSKSYDKLEEYSKEVKEKFCTFKTGKRYEADLSASYNIGGRYLIRELLKACPGTEASEARAKVPGLSARAICTLSTYISLLAVKASA